MTDEQIKEALLDWVKNYCKNPFLIPNPEYDGTDELIPEYVTSLPGGVLIFLNQAVVFLKAQNGIKSESLGDYSVSFETDYPASFLKLLRPYRKVYL